MTLPTNRRLGHYEIQSTIGVGGMGEVYLARDTSELERTVALKLLRSEVASDDRRMQRFVQEAKTVSALNHPNILTIYEFGQEGSVRFIATEFVDGVTLREKIRSRKLKLHDVLDIAIQIAAALNAAHEAGIAHRDIKPENIMVRRDHIVKVLDFGLAKLTMKEAAEEGVTVDSEAGTRVIVHTEPGMIMGTVSYMSPEQSQGSADIDHRTDIWSLGAVLYEMVSGRVPFEGKDLHRQIIAIQENEPAPLSKFAEGVPARLEEIVEKTLAKDRDERYQTAKDLLIDLRNLKRKLDVDAEIERTFAPEFRSPSTSNSGAAEQTSLKSAASTAEPTVLSSNLRPGTFISRIGQHKIAAAIAAAVLILGVVVLGNYLHARNTEVAIESIAVLPFDNQNHDPETDYLSDGVTEGIINSLTQLPNLKVIARSSVFHYKGKEADPFAVGKELGVRAVLTGRMFQRGDEVKVSTELIDVRDGKQLWGEQYTQKISDLMSLQRDIAGKIVGNLRLRLSGEEHNRMMKHYTDNAEAYQLYLKGRYYWNKRNAEALRKSADYFRQAIDKDPGYALAYSGLADAYSLIPNYGGGSPQEFVPKAHAAALKAVELDDTLAEAHASLGNVLIADWKWNEAIRQFQRAIELNPNYATAHQWYSDGPLLAMGRFDEANAEMKRAQELDPLSLIIDAEVGANYIMARQYDKAIEQLSKTLELDPGFSFARLNMATAYALKGDNQRALAELKTSLQQSDNLDLLGSIGYVEARSGKRDDAVKTLNEMKESSQHRYVSAYSFALVYVALGDKEQAFQSLEKSYQDHSEDLALIKVDPMLDPLRSDPRFDDLMRRVGVGP